MTIGSRSQCIAGIGLLLVSLWGSAAEATLRVVATIPPLHSLVAQVTEGVIEPQLLLSRGGSPHGYSLRPSEMRMVHAADLLFWVGPEMEGFLHQTIARLDAGTVVVALTDPGVHSENEHDEHDEHDEHAHEPHQWLNPQLAGHWVERLVEQMVLADPQHAQRYTENGAATIERLKQLDQTLERQLSTVQKRPFVVHHNAYQHLVDRYRLNLIGVVAQNPEGMLGARSVSDLLSELAQYPKVCLFGEPQFPRHQIRPFRRLPGLIVGELDPLGRDVAPGVEHYAQMMRNLSAALKACLSQE